MHDELEIKRREDGSIDVEHYVRIGLMTRSHAANRELRRLARLLRRVAKRLTERSAGLALRLMPPSRRS